MAIVRRTTRMPVFTSPWRELDDLFTNRLNRLVDEGWSGISQAPAGDWVPAVNVDETKDELLLTAELPGMSEENVEIELENNILTIKGEKMEETREDEARSHLYERRYGSFSRAFTLPDSVDEEKVNAKFEKGVLKIVLPKTKTVKSPSKKIEIG